MFSKKVLKDNHSFERFQERSGSKDDRITWNETRHYFERRITNAFPVKMFLILENPQKVLSFGADMNSQEFSFHGDIHSLFLAQRFNQNLFRHIRSLVRRIRSEQNRTPHQ